MSQNTTPTPRARTPFVSCMPPRMTRQHTPLTLVVTASPSGFRLAFTAPGYFETIRDGLTYDQANAGRISAEAAKSHVLMLNHNKLEKI